MPDTAPTAPPAATARAGLPPLPAPRRPADASPAQEVEAPAYPLVRYALEHDPDLAPR
jgi:hypothetical protein